MVSGAALAACSGGSGALAPISTPTAQAHATAAPAAAPASVTFTMHWGTSKGASRARRPQYVPATAMSVSVSVNGGTPQYLNNPNTTLTIAANAGVDTFFFQTYDEPSGQGSVLSQADVTQTITAGGANFVSAVLNGVVASLAVSLDNPTAAAGTASTINVTVNALDADGNVIVGSGGYDRSVKLAIDDPEKSGALSLSTSLVQGPSTPVTLSYSGATLDHADVSASANGVQTVMANFDPTPTGYTVTTTGVYPTRLVAGPNGMVYFTDFSDGEIYSTNASGMMNSAPTPGGGTLGPLVFASDGNLWFIENSTDRIGTVRPDLSGYSDTALIDSKVSGVGALLDQGDGYLYYSDSQNYRIVAVTLSAPSTTFSYAVGTIAPNAMTVGAGHAIYFAGSGSFGDLDTLEEGGYTSFGAERATSMATGPDGNIWFTNDEEIGRFAQGGTTITNFNLTSSTSRPNAIVACGDSLWFGDYNGTIGRATTSGTITEYALPNLAPAGAQNGYLGAITCASDGSLWTSNSAYSALVRFVH